MPAAAQATVNAQRYAGDMMCRGPPDIDHTVAARRRSIREHKLSSSLSPPTALTWVIPCLIAIAVFLLLEREAVGLGLALCASAIGAQVRPPSRYVTVSLAQVCIVMNVTIYRDVTTVTPPPHDTMTPVLSRLTKNID